MQRDNPVGPARRSTAAQANAARKLDHLGTFTRNHIRAGDAPFGLIATPTPTQRRSFDLLHAPIPLTVT